MKYVRCLLVEKKGDFLKTTFKDDDFWSLPTDNKGYWKSTDYDYYYYDWYYDDIADLIDIEWNTDIEDFNLIEKYKKEYQEYVELNIKNGKSRKTYNSWR